MISCMREHLSVGMCEGILASIAHSDFSPRDWKTSNRRKALIAFLCKRAAVFLPDDRVARLQDALDLTAYSTWRRSDTAGLPKPAPNDVSRFSSPRARTPPQVDDAQTLHISIPVIRESDVQNARTKALNLAKHAGASLFVRTRIATLVSELARRIHQQDGSGTIDLRVEQDRLVVVSRDDGPLVEGLDQILASPERHRSGPEASLVACQTLALEFDALSQENIGTTLTAKLALR